MKLMKIHILLSGLLVLIALDANSQFSRYWNESFSTKSALLSGAVVGGYADETSIFYNPSILTDSSESTLTFSNGLAKVDFVEYQNAMGEGLGVSNWESNVASGFISVGLYPKDAYGLVWKLAVFNKDNFDNSFKGEFRSDDNIFEQALGKERYVGKISSRTEYNDYWYGLGIAKRFNNRLSVGGSLFFRYSSLRYEAFKSIEVAPFDSNSILKNVAVNKISSSLRGYCWRSTLKIGVNYRVSNSVKLGMVITTPSWNIMNSVHAESKVSYVNIVSKESASFLPDVLYDATGDEMNFNIKDPLSIALGLDYMRLKYRFNFTLEWFAGLKPYRLVDGRTGDIAVTKIESIEINKEHLSYAGGGKSVFNVAVGVEKFMSNGRSWLFGFKTDFDALNNFDYQELSGFKTLVNAKTDYYHFSAGKNFRFLRFDVLFGLEYSLSRAKNLRSFANFSPPITVDPKDPYHLEGQRLNNMTYKGDALVIFVGITLKEN